MDVDQTRLLLTAASAFDDRRVTAEVVTAWHALVGHLAFDLATAAMKRYYQRSRYRMMPADLLEVAAELQPAADSAAAEVQIEQFCRAVGITRTEYELHALDQSWLDDVKAAARREVES